MRIISNEALTGFRPQTDERQFRVSMSATDPLGSFGILLEISLRGPGSCVWACELTAMRFRPF